MSRYYRKRRLQHLTAKASQWAPCVILNKNGKHKSTQPPQQQETDEYEEETTLFLEHSQHQSEQQILQEYGEQIVHAVDPIPVEDNSTEDSILHCDYGTFMATYEALNFPLYMQSSISTLEAVLLIQQFILHSNTNKSQADNLLKLIGALLPHKHALPGSYKAFMKVWAHTDIALITILGSTSRTTTTPPNSTTAHRVGTFTREKK